MLNLPGGAPGGVSQCHNITYTGPKQTFAPVFPVPTIGSVFFVATDGSDSAAGSMTAPFASVERAVKAIREKADPAGGAVVLRAGMSAQRVTLS